MSTKKLKRSSTNVLIAGVCAGFAEYFNQDPTVWRLGFVFFLLITGLMPGLLMYLIAWILLPQSA
ncbi:PspC domain-containing protein [Candidatus Nomurabacteria bacterium]|nr:PspC domain-containing protein [Candidatus Nomurabacteria bacterium]MCB9819246.1 PspC domain-containing protein [Candidatus Nomurabacteria bacterium]